jgi:hypothetical protein
VKRLGAGQPAGSRFAVPVDLQFDVGQKIGRVLDLVDEQGGGESLEKEGRVFPGKGKDHRIVERNIGPPFPAQVAKEGRLSDLSGPGDEQDRELPGGFRQEGFQRPSAIHGRLRLPSIL